MYRNASRLKRTRFGPTGPDVHGINALRNLSREDVADAGVVSLNLSFSTG